MQVSEALQMLKHNDLAFVVKTAWADLGCGKGIFTLALAELLQPQSIIYAMDKNTASLQQLPETYHSVIINKQRGDFVNDKLSFNGLDGILMANSLHYVKDKIAFLRKATACVKENGCFLIVEYDMDTANKWVPYPISFISLRSLFLQAGFSVVKKLDERPSIYGRANMYSAVVRK
jgi:ubiquinone/menaquinone biosynthesis C-methylase UbiE